MFRKTMIAAAASVVMLASGGAKAHDYKIGDLEIQHPWARASATQAAKAGAAYLTIKNNGNNDAHLVSATAGDLSRKTELHNHTMDENGVMRMRQVEKITIPAGETISLQPGGLHVMFMGLNGPLKEGDKFDMTLSFEKAGSLPISVHVEKVAAQKKHSHH